MSNSTMRMGVKPFTDIESFSKGIGKGQAFSVYETFVLEKYGTTMELLANGSLLPENEEERHFVAVCKGIYSPENVYEKVWMKYIRISSKKQSDLILKELLTNPIGEIISNNRKYIDGTI